MYITPRHATALTAAVTLVTLLAGCSDDSSSSVDSAAGATLTRASEATGDTDGSDRCTTADLDISVGASDGAAGSVYRALEFRNISDSDCTLSGYPGVSLVTGSDGATQVGEAADREPGEGDAPVITLAPEASASADLKITDPGVYGDQCTATPATALKIYPPEEQDATVVTVDGLVGCTGEDAPVTLRISRLQEQIVAAH
ncbi:DUF4232 domain-containing protein [Corynebacterium terpenotabidum]|uniref:DUF4232 domain-containing protein n=1 Tax=Corynebacterium terpenotabidum Y-11 TaxID=1200352 RepID=S4XF29_9CORY|nr:DUF4232 domain-containing protein [Corynebacterium terpenotabidum]AGP31179.1 hypothetical protein A606_07660 [Corynebacterium terpenotabidum Y-11]